jgi:putative NADH-flavin reductase
MKLTVFGATGGVGRHVVTGALNRGDHVTAYVRNPTKLDISHPNLTVVAGELTDRDSVAHAVRSADAVISALGPSLDRKATGMPLVDGTRTIVEAMETNGVERYIGVATPSLRDPRDTRSLLGLVVPFMGRTFLKGAYHELLKISEIVTASSLNWTIARFTQPKDGERTGTVRAGFLGQAKIGAAITRADIAGGLVGTSSRGPTSIGAPGFEPGTSPTRTVRATRLRHAPRETSSVSSPPRRPL